MIRYPFRRKTATSGAVTLIADADESLEVLDIGVDTPQDDKLLDVKIDTDTIQRFLCGGNSKNMLPAPISGGVRPTFWEWLRSLTAIDVPTIKVASGQTLTLTPSGTYTRLYVYYREADAAEWPREADGGLRGRRRLFASIGSNTDVSAAANLVLEITTSDNQTGHNGWPWTCVVPNGIRYHVFAIGGVPVKTAAGVTNTTFLRVMRETDRIITPSGDPYVFNGSATPKNELPIGDDADYRGLHVFDPPMVFGPGERLSVEVLCIDDAANHLAAGDVQVVLLAVEERI